MIATRDRYSITTEQSRLDIDFIHRFLTQSYWAQGISKETVAQSIRGSLCFGVFDGDRQVGFARVITDEATFAYLADVFIDETYRGRGLGRWLMEIIFSHNGLQGLRRFMLATKDAHGLYARFGFTPLTQADRWMQVHRPDIYQNPA